MNTWRIKLIQNGDDNDWSSIYLSIFDDQTINVERLDDDGYVKTKKKENRTPLYGIRSDNSTCFNMGIVTRNSKD